ncbi:MAG: HNH endonuclease [Candidatus Thiodiazotropha sp.]|jgi:hypothetical protein
MGRELGNLDQELAQQTRSLEKASQELKWEMAQAGLSAAGIVDPTPITDTINAGISFARGDVVGGLIDLASGWIPYLGDSLKGLKAGKVADKIAGLKKSIESLSKFADKYKDLYARRREAAKRVRESRKQKACQQPCGESKWGTQLPKSGKFDGERGNSKWTSDDGKYSIEYKEGYPDFKTATTPDGKPAVLDEVEISQTGRNSDFSKASSEAGYPKPKGYTWHHHEDGVTMQLVDSSVHNRAFSSGGSGAAHTGGSSIVKDPQF